MTEPVPTAMRVLIAPDCFGDSLTAVAAAIPLAWKFVLHDYQKARV